MAQKPIVTYFSDLSGTEITESPTSIRFGLDDHMYEIELTREEQDELRAALAKYVASARELVPTARSRRAPASQRRYESSARRTGATRPTYEVSAKEIREWAIANGHDVPARGRIPAAAAEAYHLEHQSTADGR